MSVDHLFGGLWILAVAVGVYVGSRATRWYHSLVGLPFAAAGILMSFGYSNSHPFPGGEDWSESTVVAFNGITACFIATFAFAIAAMIFAGSRRRRGARR